MGAYGLRVLVIKIKTLSINHSPNFLRARSNLVIQTSTMSTAIRTVLVTGGTSGLGYHCALEIARQRPDYLVLIASRSNPDSAAISINTLLGQKNVEYLPLDLSDFANIRTFAANYADPKYPPLAALVLNAGSQFPGGISYTKDGIEKTFAINHIGHCLLFYLLRSHFAPKCRVVLTSSGTHDPTQNTGLPNPEYTTAEELAHPSAASGKKNKGRQRYATSKLCNLMWTYALHRRLIKSDATTDSKSWTVTAMDPGFIPGTGLSRNASWLERWLFVHVLPRVIPLLRRLVNPNIHTPHDSGLALARLAVGEDVEGVRGKYFEGMKQIESSVESYEVPKQEDLWTWTAKHVAVDETEASDFETLS
ncbi:hypothetical protein MMC18_000926 [Xylographa bjoerkii]|nr:hypothetical protein [Xylographa bjoerkii]